MRWLAVALLVLSVGCGRGSDSSKAPKRAKGKPAAAATGPAATAAASAASTEPAPEGTEPGDAAETPGPVAPADPAVPASVPALLPDSEPAGAPFASSIAAAVAEVTQQGGSNLTSRIYRAAFEQARREINADNARSRLRELEKQVDAERQALP